MNLHSIKWSFLLAFLLSACSEENKPPIALPPTTLPQGRPFAKEESPVANVDPSKSIKDAQRQEEAAISRKRIMADIHSALEPLSQGADAISTIKSAWSSFNHPSLSKVISSQEFAEILQFPQKSMREELSDPSGKWNSDAGLRRAAIGRSALLVSLTGSDGSELPRFPELMTDAEKREEVTEGDLLLLKCAAHAMSLMEGRPELPNSGSSTNFVGRHPEAQFCESPAFEERPKAGHFASKCS